MAALVYTEPQYLYEPPTTAVLSETRPTNLSPPALTALNFALDELLQLWVHASLSPSTATTPPISSTVAPPLAPGPLGPKQVFTTERLKQGVIRVVGPYLGKNVVLEAELAVRELLRLAPPSLRADAALKKGNFGSPTTVFEGQDEGTAAQQADEIFRSLRAWVQLVSGLGAACPPTGPATLANHLLTLTPPPPMPHGYASSHITFITALYAERCLTFIADYLVRAVGRVTERGQSESATLLEVESAFSEDETIWNWMRGMRVRAFIEAEIATSMIRSKSSNGGSPPLTRNSPGSPNLSRLQTQQAATTATNASSASPQTSSPVLNRSSVDSPATSINYGRRNREGSGTWGLGITKTQSENSFEQLMQSGQTMKVSLTPDRLRNDQRLVPSRSRPVSTISTSTSMPILPTAAPFSSAPRNTLQARAPRSADVIDEGDDETGSRRPQESLVSMLNSPPPWSEGDGSKFASTSKTTSDPSSSPGRSRKLSLKRPSYDPTSSPGSVPMRMQDSQTSVMTQSSVASSGTDIETWLHQAPKARAPQLKAKDERKDLAHERQINNDLVDFFANSPPSASSPQATSISSPPMPTNGVGSSNSNSKKIGTIVSRDDDFSFSSTPSIASVKTKKGFRGFFSSRKDSSTSTNNSESDSLAATTSKTSTSFGRRSSNASRHSYSSNSTAAALRASGFSEAAIRTASAPTQQREFYNPPPLLATSPQLQQAFIPEEGILSSNRKSTYQPSTTSDAAPVPVPVSAIEHQRKASIAEEQEPSRSRASTMSNRIAPPIAPPGLSDEPSPAPPAPPLVEQSPTLVQDRYKVVAPPLDSSSPLSTTTKAAAAIATGAGVAGVATLLSSSSSSSSAPAEPSPAPAVDIIEPTASSPAVDEDLVAPSSPAVAAVAEVEKDPTYLAVDDPLSSISVPEQTTPYVDAYSSPDTEKDEPALEADVEEEEESVPSSLEELHARMKEAKSVQACLRLLERFMAREVAPFEEEEVEVAQDAATEESLPVAREEGGSDQLERDDAAGEPVKINGLVLAASDDGIEELEPVTSREGDAEYDEDVLPIAEDEGDGDDVWDDTKAKRAALDAPLDEVTLAQESMEEENDLITLIGKQARQEVEQERYKDAEEAAVVEFLL